MGRNGGRDAEPGKDIDPSEAPFCDCTLGQRPAGARALGLGDPKPRAAQDLGGLCPAGLGDPPSPYSGGPGRLGTGGHIGQGDADRCRDEHWGISTDDISAFPHHLVPHPFETRRNPRSVLGIGTSGG